MNKSFLKWAGGKTQSLALISESIAYIKGRFIEPFVGSGVVSLNIDAFGYVLGDCNKDLINVYNVLKNTDDFIEKLTPYFTPESNTQDMFYEYRERFNKSVSSEERAMLFVYLNRHCFNGLCRYNRSGEFNVPFGKHKEIYFPAEELISFKRMLNAERGCELYCQSFESTMSMAKEDDIIYCDPPYVSLLEDTKAFTDYSTDGFTHEQQEQLAKCAEEAPCKTLISNLDTEVTRELYKNADEIKRKKVSRTISAKGSSRKPVYELLAIYKKEN